MFLSQKSQEVFLALVFRPSLHYKRLFLESLSSGKADVNLHLYFVVEMSEFPTKLMRAIRILSNDTAEPKFWVG